MLNVVILSAILAAPMPAAISIQSDLPRVAQAAEPDGSHPHGKHPSFKANPEPPAELRGVSHRQAKIGCMNYMYEVYAGNSENSEPEWVVRYLMFPEGSEAPQEIEQVFLFAKDLSKKPKLIKPEELDIAPESLSWKRKNYKLVDRRNLTLWP
ncbi:MAG: hypothetical protein Q8O00_00045 [Holophaga sp.]|nr:hypothetical protein [Holophaga sp.]